MISNRLLACAAALGLCAASAQAACVAHVGRTSADPMALTATASALSVDIDDGHRVVTTLGTITNPTGVCFTDLVVEVQYFDAAGQHVDTLVEPLSGVVSPADEPAEFRIQGPAAKDAKSYATQRVRVTDGMARWIKGQESGRSTFVDLLLSWAPMLLLIAVWIYVMRRYSGKKSPQAKLVANSDLQVKATQELAAAAQRIALVLEKQQAAPPMA
jgi:hypothetical protein